MIRQEGDTIFSPGIVANLDAVVGLTGVPRVVQTRELLTLLAAHDHGTYQHSKVVLSISALLAGYFRIASAELHEGALLHDIGKLSVPARLMRRTSNDGLYEWDRRAVEHHARHSGEMLAYLGFSHLVVQIGYHHGSDFSMTAHDGETYIEGVHLPSLVRVADNFAAGLDKRRPYNGHHTPASIVPIVLEKVFSGQIQPMLGPAVDWLGAQGQQLTDLVNIPFQ